MMDNRIGTLNPGDLAVYINRNTYNCLEDYSRSDTSVELGSMLVGTHHSRGNGHSVFISDFIEAKYADSAASTLTFTHRTWEYIHSVMDKRHSGKKIVGWQHTHPGYGIFLSQYDLFIQENFFNLPWQTAYVIDPVAKTRGFFQNKEGGAVTELTGYYLLD